LQENLKYYNDYIEGEVKKGRSEQEVINELGDPWALAKTIIDMQESQGYTVPCYVLKMDISGYFMHINRVRLLEICLNTLERMARHRVKLHCREVWAEVVDMDFVRYLTREIVLLNPMENCILRGRASDWDDLPYNKSLFNSPIGCGLPIGNLTSQLFSNVYLNVLDQYVKRELRCRHYGRYVDDFYVVSADKKYLSNVSMAIKQMLNEVLDLCINDGKTQVVSVWKGVEFLGAYVKPFRRYASRQTVARMREKLRCLQCVEPHKRQASLCSFRGVLSHGRNYKLECRLFLIFNS
jgi:hypothetical protein